MSDTAPNTPDNDPTEGGDGGDGTQDSGVFRKLGQQRDQALEQAKEAEARADAMQREIAMLRAGVDLDSPRGGMFVKAYDGELDPSAIKSAWVEINGGAGPAQQGQPDAPSEPVGGVSTDDIDDLMSGGAGAPPAGQHPPQDPQDAGLDAYFKARREDRQSHDVAVSEYLQSIYAAQLGDNPDPRVITTRAGAHGN